MQRLLRKLSSIPCRIRNEWYNRVVLTDFVNNSNTNWKDATVYDLLGFRKKTLDYVELNHKPEINIGAYSYKPGAVPLLYASCYAALTRSLDNDLDKLTSGEREEWISYMKSFQCDDGIFRDPLIACERAETMDWWGFRHLTLHALMALNALGGVAEYPFKLLEPFRQAGYMRRWLSTRHWEKESTSVTNEVQNYGTFLQYARDFQFQSWCQDTLDEMYAWLDQAQDPETGLWGPRFDTSEWLSKGVQTGYHFWLLYTYDGRPINYKEKIIDSCLRTQNRLGGFGYFLNSSACEDIDSIDTLSRLYHLTDYRRDDICKALYNSVPWILTNFHADGGAVFRKNSAFWLHDMMSTRPEESSMFPTWFRLLSLAYISKVLVDSPLGNIEWGFLNCPGHQFWQQASN
jgi:hypothetical protein